MNKNLLIICLFSLLRPCLFLGQDNGDYKYIKSRKINKVEFSSHTESLEFSRKVITYSYAKNGALSEVREDMYINLDSIKKPWKYEFCDQKYFPYYIKSKQFKLSKIELHDTLIGTEKLSNRRFPGMITLGCEDSIKERSYYKELELFDDKDTVQYSVSIYPQKITERGVVAQSYEGNYKRIISGDTIKSFKEFFDCRNGNRTEFVLSDMIITDTIHMSNGKKITNRHFINPAPKIDQSICKPENWSYSIVEILLFDNDSKLHSVDCIFLDHEDSTNKEKMKKEYGVWVKDNKLINIEDVYKLDTLSLKYEYTFYPNKKIKTCDWRYYSKRQNKNSGIGNVTYYNKDGTIFLSQDYFSDVLDNSKKTITNTVFHADKKGNYKSKYNLIELKQQFGITGKNLKGSQWKMKIIN